jgi:hypothetical protein
MNVIPVSVDSQKQKGWIVKRRVSGGSSSESKNKRPATKLEYLEYCKNRLKRVESAADVKNSI